MNWLGSFVSYCSGSNPSYTGLITSKQESSNGVADTHHDEYQYDYAGRLSREANLAVINAPVEPELALMDPHAFFVKDASYGDDHAQLYSLRPGETYTQHAVYKLGVRK